MTTTGKKWRTVRSWVCLLLTICMLLGQLPAGVAAAEAKEFSITGINAYNFRGSDWYIILSTDNAEFNLPAAASLTPAGVTIDGAAAAGWFQPGTGTLAFTLATDKADHKVVLPAGMVLGGYTLEEDYVFFTQADGSVKAGASVTGINAYNFRGNDWYVILDTNQPALSLPAVASLSAAGVTVDGTVTGGWFQANSVMGVAAGKVAFTLATDKADHKVVIPQGTVLGNYILAEDYVFCTYADGSMSSAAFNITGINAYNFRGSDWYIILNTDNAKFNLPAVASLATSGVTVDGEATTGWFQKGTGTLAFDLDTDKAEHTVRIPAGTVLGQYTLEEDFVFYTHADGTLTTEPTEPEPSVPESTEPEEPEDKTVSITGIRESMYRPGNSDWYIILNTNIADFALTSISGIKAPVDDTTAQVWFQINSQLGVPAGSFAFTLAANKAEHAVTIPAGTVFGEYTLKEDFVFYTYADGTVGTTPPAEPVDFRFQRGAWQYIPENNLARYLVWLDYDMAGELVIPWEPLDGAYVNGEKENIYAVVDAGAVLLILNEETGITRPGSYKVTLQKGSHIGAYTIKNDITFYMEGLKVTEVAPETIAAPTETVSVINDSRNLTGDGTQGLYFGVTPSDGLPYDDQRGEMHYSAASGGVYVNGELTSLTIGKWLENLYYVPLAQFCYPPQKGDVVTIDGVFGNGDHAVTFEKQNFVYDGNGNWEIGTYLRDLREQNYIVQDVSELKMGLSEFAIKPGVQLIGDAKQGTNIAIRSIVSINTDATEFNFGFSKTEGMWDGAGWQVWIRPKFNQVYLAHGETDWQVTGHYEFTNTEFIVEIGTVDMHEYIDGVDQGLYCRKIFLKINDQEVLSYKDTDLSRNVGKKLYVLNSQDAVNGKLISLTSKGIALRELKPTVYDYYDLTGFASDTIPGGQTILLGETRNSSNIAVRMKMNLSGDATEVRLALAKQQKDNFWDAAESGWQVWLRPKWDTAYIAHGTNDHEVIKPFPYSGTYTVEMGVRDVIIEKDGKKIGNYCRRVYLLINGEEIASWEDTDFSRPIGNCVMLLTSQDSQVSLSTMKKTAKLPVEIAINGETVDKCDFVEVINQVVSGAPSKISVLYHSDYNTKVILKGLYLNGTLLQPIQSADGKQVYALDAPVETDQLRVELEVKKLTADEPERIFDLFDTSGKAVVEVRGKQYGVSLGAMVGPEGQAEVNSAVRFRLRLPNQFNQVPIGILGDVSTLWGYSGALFQITPSQVHFCHTASMTRLASFASNWFAPGSNVCVELGIVKCYENGLYKYDRWYVKAGKTEDTMEIVAWYDSVERGHYGGHFSCNGTDMEESYFLYSLKDIYTITDVSSEDNKAQLRTYERWGENIPELYFPSALEGYKDIASASKAGVIRFFTKPGTSLSSFTVNGKDVTKDVQIGADGAYCYNITELKNHISFAYEIAEDATTHAVTVQTAPELDVTVDQAQVLTGGDIVLTVTAKKGFVPQVMANGTDVTQLLRLNPETGVWSGVIRSVRSDIQIKAEAVQRSYTLAVQENAYCTVTLGGDAADGKLPYGGKLELTVQIEDGYYVEYILVGDQKLSVNKDGKLVLDRVYMDLQDLEIQCVAMQSSGAEAKQTEQMNLIVWIGLGAVCVLAAAIGAFLFSRRAKRKADKK